MKTNIIPICTREFREVVKGCGTKYRNKIPIKELKAVLSYRPLDKGRNVEVSNETRF